MVELIERASGLNQLLVAGGRDCCSAVGSVHCVSTGSVRARGGEVVLCQSVIRQVASSSDTCE